MAKRGSPARGGQPPVAVAAQRIEDEIDPVDLNSLPPEATGCFTAMPWCGVLHPV